MPATHTSTRGTGRSIGSIGFSGVWEFIISHTGDLYKAPVYSPLDLNGYRQGARFEATAANDHGDNFARYLRIQGFDTLTDTADPKYASH
jgi:hypothetical protein